METFIAILHILVAFVLIILVLVQDTKSGSIGGAFGGGGSNSVFGATGATTLAQKLTRYTAVIFAGTCIMLTIYAAKTSRSVLDSATLPVEAAQTPAANPTNPNGGSEIPANGAAPGANGSQQPPSTESTKPTEAPGK